VQLIKPVEPVAPPALAPPAEIDESRNRPLTVTPAAATRVRELLAQKGKPEGALRLRITSGGCSGKEYQMDLVEGPAATDRVFSVDGARVVVDFRSLVFLMNCTLDYRADLFGAQFTVDNPNAKHTCSCGLSFTV
jgi:iron-sulfur cluster insertion protein